MQPVEDRQALPVAPHRLAIDRGRCRPQARHGLTDAGIPVRPVEAVAGEQPHPGLPLAGDEAVAVVLDLVNPLGADRRLARSGRDTGFDHAGPLHRRLGTPLHTSKMASRGHVGKGN
jgi:hypothetical protein